MCDSHIVLCDVQVPKSDNESERSSFQSSYSSYTADIVGGVVVKTPVHTATNTCNVVCKMNGGGVSLIFWDGGDFFILKTGRGVFSQTKLVFLDVMKMKLCQFFFQ